MTVQLVLSTSTDKNTPAYIVTARFTNIGQLKLRAPVRLAPGQ